MEDFENNCLNHLNNYNIEENNIQIGQEEEDFESAFNQIFVQKKVILFMKFQKIIMISKNFFI